VITQHHSLKSGSASAWGKECNCKSWGNNFDEICFLSYL